MDDLISRKAVIDKAITIPIAKIVTEDKVIYRRIVFVEDIENLPSAQPDVPDTNVGDMVSRRFLELLAEYHDPELCTYKEYKGKPYFSIKYIENGEGYVGYGTYSPKVLSEYLRKYFMSSAQPEQNAYEQGRITGRVEMRTEILSALKNMVGSEVWNNV